MNQRRSSPQRPPTRPAGTSTAVTIVLVVVAALLGLFILNRISDDSGGGSASATTEETSDTSAENTTTSSTVPEADMAAAKVLVANGAGVKGLAGAATTSLQSAFPGTTFLTPTDANAKYQASAVYYTQGFEGQAAKIATSIGLTASGLFPPALPLADPTKIADANVLVLLGADKAGGVTATPPVAADAVTGDTTTSSSAPPTS